MNPHGHEYIHTLTNPTGDTEYPHPTPYPYPPLANTTLLRVTQVLQPGRGDGIPHCKDVEMSCWGSSRWQFWLMRFFVIGVLARERLSFYSYIQFYFKKMDAVWQALWRLTFWSDYEHKLHKQLGPTNLSGPTKMSMYSATHPQPQHLWWQCLNCYQTWPPQTLKTMGIHLSFLLSFWKTEQARDCDACHGEKGRMHPLSLGVCGERHFVCASQKGVQFSEPRLILWSCCIE